jgi:hypothetical protein
MNEGKFEEILNAKIDVGISAEEAAVLDEYLANHPEAQAYAEDLDGLCRVLKEVKEVEPPVDLKQEILGQIRDTASVPPVSQATVDLPDEDSWWATLVQTVRSWMRPQLAYAFATGVVASVLLIVVFAGGLSRLRLDEGSVPGSMLPVEESAFELVDSTELQLGSVHAIATASRFENMLLAEVRVESETPVEMLLQARGAQIAPLGFQQARESSGAIRLEAGDVAVTHVGQNTYWVLLTAGGTGDLRVRLQVGSEIVEETLRTGSP